MNNKILIANWKMYPVGAKRAQEIFKGIKDKARRSKKVNTIICPPFLFLPFLLGEYKGEKIKFGAQNCFYEERGGSYTGEISPGMLSENKISYVIVGHSERRALGESDEIVNSKIKAALNQGLIAVLCIGESKRDDEGEYFSTLRNQIENDLQSLHKTDLNRVIIAYEPIWAIGKSEKEAINSDDLHTMRIFIRKVLADKYGKKRAIETPVLYGGSVNSLNAEELLRGDIDGFLLGRAGRNPEEFNKIIEILNKK